MFEKTIYNEAGGKVIMHLDSEAKQTVRAIRGLLAELLALLPVLLKLFSDCYLCQQIYISETLTKILEETSLLIPL